MSRSHDLMKDLKTYECRDSSYQDAEPPLVFERAKGSEIWDAEGRRYIDLCAGFGVLSLGHNNAVQQKVFAECFSDNFITHGMGDVYPSVAKIELLKYLAGLLPDHLERGALALSGGQAVELAVKTAQIATGRTGFITFEGSYHGLDLGILPLTSRADFKEPFLNWLPTDRVKELPFEGDLEAVEAAVVAQSKAEFGTAAIVVEPLQGRAGIRPASKAWLEGLRRICDKHGALLIFDEVFIGLGRLGRISAAAEVPADLVCLGKALGGSLPLSACFGRASVMDAWPANKGEAIHTGTFFGHPLSCRLGLATLKAMVEDGWMQRAADFGAKIVSDLREGLKDQPLVKDIRGQGLMIGLELVRPGLGAQLMDQLRAQGIIALASGTYGEGISITPALNISDELWQEAFGELRLALQRLS